MKTCIVRYFSLLLAVLLPILLCGCTVNGALLGYVTDDRNDRFIHAIGAIAHTIPSGRTVVVKCTNGRVVTGTFSGVKPLPSNEYSANYASARSQLDSIVKLPALGDTLIIIRNSGSCFEWIFHGFAPQALAANGGWSTTAQRFPLDLIDQMQSRTGQSYNMEQLRKLMNAQLLPFNAGVIVDFANISQQIPLNEVAEITAQPKHTYWWMAGAYLGFAVDALIVSLIVR
jgi:hypothetical protein